MIISHFPGDFGDFQDKRFMAFGYTGTMELTSDAKQVRFLTDGTLTMYQDMYVDVFLVGGGGAGGEAEYHHIGSYTEGWSRHNLGGGGGGGYTVTRRDLLLEAGETYTLTIGSGGGDYQVNNSTVYDGGDTVFTDGDALTITAAGGKHGGDGYIYGVGHAYAFGGNGGSGGGAGRIDETEYDGEGGTIGSYGPYNGAVGAGGTNGSDGEDGGGPTAGGTGQGTTTKAFGETNGELFSSGGDGGAVSSSSSVFQWPQNGAANTGDGGQGGGYTDNISYTGDWSSAGGKGGSGIIIIRSAEVA